MQLLQWGASHDEETAVLNGQRGATAAGLPVDSSSTGRRRLCGRTLLEAVLVVGLLASTSAAIGLAVRGRDARAGAGAGCPPPPECLHALGGGPVNPGGGIGSATAGECTVSRRPSAPARQQHASAALSHLACCCHWHWSATAACVCAACVFCACLHKAQAARLRSRHTQRQAAAHTGGRCSLQQTAPWRRLALRMPACAHAAGQ